MNGPGLWQALDWKDRRGMTWFVSFEVDETGEDEDYRGVLLHSAEGADLTPAVVRKLADDLGALKERDRIRRREFWAEVARTERNIALRNRAETALQRTRGTRMGPTPKYPLDEVAEVVREALDEQRSVNEALRERFGVSKSYASRLYDRVKPLLDERRKE
jgi:hypothetical protein